MFSRDSTKEEMSLPELVSVLYPASVKWLESKGYVKYGVDDHRRVIEVTPSGLAYFYKIMTQYEPK